MLNTCFRGGERGNAIGKDLSSEVYCLRAGGGRGEKRMERRGCRVVKPSETILNIDRGGFGL